MSATCYLCGSGPLSKLFDVGLQPIGNRFLTSPSQPEERFPLAMQQCEACGLTQIEQAVPARALVPPFDWITYDEPEGHLDELVDILAALPGIGPGSIAAGVSFKDDSTLARLAQKGLSTWRLDIERDLGATDVSRGFGVETIQDRLTAAAASRVLEGHKPADIFLVRHILEHSADPRDFIEALKRLTAPGGYLVIEVPDCSRALDGFDYTVIWEEHVLYFTPRTFRQGISIAGLDVLRMENYPYPFENSLVAIAKSNGVAAPSKAPAAVPDAERARGLTFGKHFPEYRDKVHKYLRARRASGDRIALFGAGHLACTWVNNLGVEDEIDCVIDDNPNKTGLYMPGCKLQILDSRALLARDIALCLLSLNPIGQEKVIAKNADFVERGGEFASIFPSSARALRL